MEDSLSVKSSESVATSEEFDFISDKPGTSKTPTLEFRNGDLNELRAALTEVLREPEMDLNEAAFEGAKKVGHSLFYGCPVTPGTDPLSAEIGVSPTEKQDVMKPDFSDEEGNCFSFRFD